MSGSIQKLGTELHGSPISSGRNKKFSKGVKSSTGRIEFTDTFLDYKIDSMRSELVTQHKKQNEATIDPRSTEHLRDHNDLFNKGKSSKTTAEMLVRKTSQ